MNDNGDMNTRSESEEPKAPRKLVASLKELSSHRVFVPPSVDESIFRTARKHLLKPQPPQPRWFRFAFWRISATALAGFLIGMLIWLAGPKEQARFAAEDLNHDGEVDIIDAFQLARDLSSPQNIKRDLNRDGVVDQRDVEFLARQAVKLERGGQS